jgi:methionyl-tRNA formyltransferase
MKTLYFGHVETYARVCAEESDLLGVLWHPARGAIAERTRDLLDFCAREGIRALRHERIDREVLALVSELAPDLVVVGEYNLKLPAGLLAAPRLGAINLHAAPLPRYRGQHPLQWMIIQGETEGAVTCHYLTEGLDAGPIIGQAAFPIGPEDTAAAVRPRITATGGPLLRGILRRFAACGRLPATPQDEAAASWFPPRRPEDGELNWAAGATRAFNLIRALARPYPGAFCRHRGGTVRLDAALLPVLGQAPGCRPGTVLTAQPGRLVVAAGDGLVIATDWQAVDCEIDEGDILGTTPDP